MLKDSCTLLMFVFAFSQPICGCNGAFHQHITYPSTATTTSYPIPMQESFMHTFSRSFLVMTPYKTCRWIMSMLQFVITPSLQLF
ncbi:hypothetical protein GALMADRAFT_720284 [Galerina marginata CBS 339.88]|uniref:Secreted protein n=1 Tax=Galerina marginata (strain CBS 339.88) TaxID=685588 RepID=A0A067U002_GALM3|nr:hypothetical protein GALMADRAFT_720284 [Galerina marginata CBS 339.88]